MAKPLFACHAAFMPFETEKGKIANFRLHMCIRDMYHLMLFGQRNLRSGKNRNANHSKNSFA